MRGRWVRVRGADLVGRGPLVEGVEDEGVELVCDGLVYLALLYGFSLEAAEGHEEGRAVVCGEALACAQKRWAREGRGEWALVAYLLGESA